MKKLLWIFLLLGPAWASAQTCPAGTTPLPWGVTRDGATDLTRQIFCQDFFGHIYSSLLAYNGIVSASGLDGADAGEKLHTCVAAVASVNGICDGTGFWGTQTVNVNIWNGVTGGGMLVLGNATFNTSATQIIPPNWSVMGLFGGKRAATGFSDPNAGTTFLWTGAASSQIVRIWNAHHVVFKGITLDGGAVTTTTGLKIDSDNTIPLFDVRVEDFNIYRCAVGIQWGTGLTSFEADKVKISHGHIESHIAGGIGIEVTGANKGQDSEINGIYLFDVDKGLRLVGGSGYMTVRNFSCGTPTTTATNAVKNPCIFTYSTENTIIEGGGSESGSPDGHGMKERVDIWVPADGLNSDRQTLTISHRTINEPVLLEGTVKVLSLGNGSGSKDNFAWGNNSIQRAGNVLSVTTAASHLLAVGGGVWVQGVTSDLTMNGSCIIATTPAANQYTCAQTGANTGPFAEGNSYLALAIANKNSAQHVISIGDWFAPYIGAINGSLGWVAAGGSRLTQITDQQFILNAGESLIIGDGTAITKHFSGSASLDFTALAANSCEVLTISASGAVDGDRVVLGVPNALADVDGATERTTFFAWVSAADTVSVRRCNVTGAATANPAAATVWVDVWKH